MPSDKVPDVRDDYKYIDMVDMDGFSRLLQSFYAATGVPNGLVGVDGELITQAGWTDACHKFHRTHPKSNQLCQESNLELMQELRDGEVACALCKNGLIDYATPVVIGGHQLATLFLGQVLNEPPDIEFFIDQAEIYGYDWDEYLEAIRNVPVITQERMESLMECIVGIAQMLAGSGLAQLRQSKLEHDLSSNTKRRIQLEDILDSSPVGIGWSDVDGKIEYLNHQFTQLFGYTLRELPDIQTWHEKAYPNPYYRQTVITPWAKAVNAAHDSGATPPDIEVNVRCKDGTERHVVIHVSWVGDKRLVNFSDMTAHWKSELRNRTHDEMLEMAAKGKPLVDIMHAIVHAVESEAPNTLCSILLLDDGGKHLLNGASPSLPSFYNKAIDGIEIGMGVGSCGTAAYLGERVIVDDVMTHEYWQPYSELAQRAGLGACWSEPILSTDGEVLGTFAIYHAKPAKPTQDDFELISFAANLAAIAIENRNAHKKLERQAYFDYLTGLANRHHFIHLAETELSRFHRYQSELSLFMFDIDDFKQINDAHGHNIGDRVLQQVGATCGEILRDIDIVGRIGGEEFAVLLPHADKEHATKVAERLRSAIAEAAVAARNGVMINVTASFGLVMADEQRCSIDELLIHADRALYKAKALGKNRLCVADNTEISC